LELVSAGSNIHDYRVKLIFLFILITATTMVISPFTVIKATLAPT